MGNRIREIRQDRAKTVPTAFTIAAVAQRVGVTIATLRRWELGESLPRRRHARALARELGVQVNDLGLEESAPDHA